MAEIKKEQQKFMCLIIPMKDADQFLQGGDLLMFNKLKEKYASFRISKSKNASNNYIIVNQDEPYAEDVWQMILAGERKKRGL